LPIILAAPLVAAHVRIKAAHTIVISAMLKLVKWMNPTITQRLAVTNTDDFIRGTSIATDFKPRVSAISGLHREMVFGHFTSFSKLLTT
jgi:hypothetical protein